MPRTFTLLERHATKLAWLLLVGAGASAFAGDPLWRWVAGLGPGAAYAFGAFCGSAVVCAWGPAGAALERGQRMRGAGFAALGSLAFLALACCVPVRHGRLFGSVTLADGRRMWVEQHPAALGAVGAGVALGAVALWWGKRSGVRRGPGQKDTHARTRMRVPRHDR
ncbi:hypothetical protein [Streptomyces longispororuber]|uniref:hypothetical protein n=1 Tax=Streptomyces longispororuber TaxID=68230 RepID=UPI0036F72A62